MSMIDWTNCPDVESVPGRCSGAWVVKDTRLTVDAILNNAEDCSAEEVADMFAVPVEIVRRILAFAGITPLDYSDIPELGDEFFARAKRVPTMTDSATPLPLRGEEWLTALLLAMVIDHCTGHSPEKERQLQAHQATYLSPDPSPGEWLNSYNSPANAEAMQELEGLIEIVEQDGAHILAKLTPKGRAMLDQLRAEQERKPRA
jgi:uncharacterized protein (DUF433 family)